MPRHGGVAFKLSSVAIPLMLSYRHAFHAGNHADVLKHLVLLELLRYFNKKDKPWWFIDTHAGAGCYALQGDQAVKTGEFEAGIARLWQADDLPEPLAFYQQAVSQFNPHGKLNFYPGSPALAMTQLREQDRMRLFELHPTDFSALSKMFERDTDRVIVRKADGFSGLKSLLPPQVRRGIVLIDPPYEVKDDYRRVLEVLSDAIKRFPNGTYALWYPLLQRYEAQALPDKLRRLGAASWLDVRLAVCEPSTEGFGMFGSGMFVINPPWLLPASLEASMPWLVHNLTDGQGGFDLEHVIE